MKTSQIKLNNRRFETILFIWKTLSPNILDFYWFFIVKKSKKTCKKNEEDTLFFSIVIKEIRIFTIITVQLNSIQSFEGG